MLLYVILAIIQIAFNILRILEIKYSYDEDIPKTLVIGFLMSIVWLMSTSLGVTAVLNLDYIMMIDYILSSLLGKYLALKLRHYWKLKKNDK